MTVTNAIDWHTQIATDFDKKYLSSKNFIEPFAIWTKLIDKYSHQDFRVLDLGCGSGIFTIYSAERNSSAIGMDGSEEMLKICRQRKANAETYNVDFIQSNINDLQQNLTEKFDLIICSSVLEYLDDLEGSLRSISSSLNENGLLIFSMPNRQSFYRKLESVIFKLTGRPKYYEYVKNVCTLREMESKLKDHGFNLLESNYFGEAPFLSKLFRTFGLPCYADNLFVVVARVTSQNRL